MELNSNSDIEMWDWQGGDFSLQKDSELGVPHFLWNDMNRTNSDSLYSWEEHTPIKGCGDLGFDLDLEDKTNRTLESREPSQIKRQRMLQFSPDANDTGISHEQISIEPDNSKEFEGSLLADEFLQCLEWDPEWNSCFSDGRCAFGNEGFDQSSEGWLADCITETETHQSSGEMSSCTNDSAVFSEPFKIPSKQESVKVREKPKPAICRIFRGGFQIGDGIKPLDPKSVASIVHYGRLRHPLHHEATGYSLVYSQLYPFEGLQNYTSGIIHHVRITGLKPGALYYYRCGDPSIAMSDVHIFKTMPASGPCNYLKRIAIVGDLGLTYNTTSTVDHMRSNKPDLILLVGDVTYANMYLTNGTSSDCYSCAFHHTPIHESYQPRWDYWGRFMEPTVSEIPIMVIEGNHEIEEQAENKTLVSYGSRFAFPSEESGSPSTFYYSFNAGGIHFIMLGGYISHNRSGEQYKRLERDLSNVDRRVTPWLIATWHPPWYSSYKAHYREAGCMRVEMEELLYSYGVDVVFTGHVHAYERSNRVYNYTLDPCAPLHIMIGDGGNREKITVAHADDPGHCPDPLTTPDWSGSFCAFNFTTGPAAGKFCWDRQPDYSAYRESSFGHGILEVKNETHALWTWHRNQDLYKAPGDQIYIVSNRTSALSADSNHHRPTQITESRVEENQIETED